VDDILLIDPSHPPFGRLVEELISFDTVTLKACAVGRHQEKPVVTRTVEFLNGPAWESRFEQYEYVKDALRDAKCLDEWRWLRRQPTLDPTCWPKCRFETGVTALEKADDIYQQYLADGQPFSAAIGVALQKKLGLSVSDFRRFSEAFQAYLRSVQGQSASPPTDPQGVPGQPPGGSASQTVFNIKNSGDIHMAPQISTQGPAIITIGSTIANSKQIIQTLPSLRTEERTQLTELVEEFGHQVEKLQETHAAEAALLAKRLEEALEAFNRPKDDRGRPLVRMTVDGLKSAAHAVKEIVPDLLSAANQIALFLVGQG
jgi:hypothetical protein